MERTEFDALTREAGIALPEAVAAELCGVADHVRAMAARNGGERARAAEPATCFAVEAPR